MKFYICAPLAQVSGGPELAHQLSAAIHKLTKHEVYMCYVDCNATDINKVLPIDADSPQAYLEYGTSHVVDIEEMDQPENIVIVPEGLTPSFFFIQKARKVLWWMSVDNYVISMQEENLEELEKTVELHLLQSHYAKTYLESKMKDPKMLFVTDYINRKHGQFLKEERQRLDLVLYNPKKGYEVTKVLMKKITWVKWFPIIGLNLDTVILLMQSAKVYVDFGNHPGKDRIPREATANGCCILTNKRGSAAFWEDVPIPEQYKFENPLESVDEIGTLLKDICENFAVHTENFANYREWIKGEPERFEQEVLEFVQHIEKKD